MKVRGNISKLAKWIGQTLVVLIISAIVGLLMLLAVYKLGTGMIYSHVLESALALEKEGNSYDIGGIEAYITDSFDDAIFLNQAMVKGEHGLLSAALSGYTYSPEGAESPAEALTECLKKDVNLSEYSLGAPLVRFWCGYLVPLKILLKFLTLSQLRMLNLYLQPLIILIMMLLMVKRGLGRYVIPVFLPYLLLGPISMELCLAYAGYFYCTFIPCILLLIFYEKLRDRWLGIFFLMAGVSAIYFNINFFQLISFAFPFAILCLMDDSSSEWREKSIYDGIRKLIICFINWFAGFAGMMVLKWILYAICVDRSILAGMYNNIIFRSGSADEAGNAISRWEAIMKNVSFTLSLRSWIIIELLFLIGCIIWTINSKTNRLKISHLPVPIVMVILTMVLIMVRYALFPNHVWTHEWVMYRLCAIPVLVFNCCLIRFILHI